MNLNGMPIQFLNGIETDNSIDQQYQDVLNGTDFDNYLNGLGSADDAMFQHLTKTRNVVAAKPHLVTNQNPSTALQMLDYATKYWHTPHREKALDILEKKEQTLMGLGTISYDFEDGEVLEGFWSKVKKGFKKVGHAIKRFNPLSVAARAGFLTAFRLNMGQFATKSYPAITSGFPPDVTAKSKEAYDKIKKLFVDKLGGKEKNLQKAIRSGYKRKWTKKIPQTEADFSAELNANESEIKKIEKEDGVSGLGVEPVTAAAAGASTAAAAPFLAKVAKIFSKGVTKAVAIKQNVETIKKGVDDLKTTFKNTPTETEETNITNKPMNDTNPTFMSKVKRYAPLAIGAIALGVGVYFFTRKKKEATTRRGVSGINGIDGLEGVRKQRTTKRKRTTTTARKPKLTSGRESNARRVRTR